LGWQLAYLSGRRESGGPPPSRSDAAGGRQIFKRNDVGRRVPAADQTDAGCLSTPTSKKLGFVLRLWQSDEEMTLSDYDQLQAKKHDAHPIVRQIIDRDCHVAEPNLAVVRHVVGKLKDGYQTFRDLPKPERCRFIEQCLDVHRANRAEYEAVMWPRYERLEPPEP
jgi:hypothetical protein